MYALQTILWAIKRYFVWPRVRLVSAARFPAFFQSPEAQSEVLETHGEQKEENVTEVGADQKKMCGFGGRWWAIMKS